MPDLIDDETFDGEDLGVDEPISDAEQQEREKTMTIRDKLSRRKQDASGATDPAPAKKKSSGKSRGGLITPLLIFFLLVVGVLLLIQFQRLSDSINAAVLGGGTFDVTPLAEANMSYEYAIDFILDQNLKERMAERGGEGWQVVGSMRNRHAITGEPGYEFIFMRRTR
ncbi:MAG: hypothetical protein IJT02_06405 [Synergistaceae bacterium]|nr:hypothetical protein [Synergistaceae bacterium]